MVATPDGNVYEEVFESATEDIAAVRFSSRAWPPPEGVPRRSCYRFAASPDDREVKDLWTEGARAARALLRARRDVTVDDSVACLVEMDESAFVEEKPLGPSLPLVAGVKAVDETKLWVSLETRGVFARGDPIAVGLEDAVREDRALVKPVGSRMVVSAARIKVEELVEFKGFEATADARLVCPSAEVAGRPRRQWRDAVQEFRSVAFTEFAVPGPRTVTWCCTFLDRRGGGPRDHHKWWKTVNKLYDDMWGVVEHSLAMQALEIAGCYDGLDVTNIAAVELLLRKAQLVEFSYSERGPAPPRKDDEKKGKGKGKDSRVGMYDESAIFLGAHKEHGEIMVCPLLLEYVQREVEREAGVMKQIRKAREERTFLAQGQ